MDPVITFDRARMAYGDVVVLDDVTLHIAPGGLTAVIGPNGSGKSTLFGAISGLLPLAGGSVEVLGQMPRQARRDVAYVLQQTESSRLLPMSVIEVVRMGRFAARGLLGRLTREDHAAVADVMERLDITDLAHRQLRELSGGQRQRALVAQGLAQNAQILLLDEPVTGLDLLSQQLITVAMREECRRGRTVMVSTHDLSEARRADHVVLLAGCLVAHGTPEAALTTEHLRHAYGAHLVNLGDGSTLLDQHVHPHHGPPSLTHQHDETTSSDDPAPQAAQASQRP